MITRVTRPITLAALALATLVVFVWAGCTAPYAGRTAPPWELVGPFKAFKPKDQTPPAPPPATAPTQSTATQPAESAAQSPGAAGTRTEAPQPTTTPAATSQPAHGPQSGSAMFSLRPEARETENRADGRAEYTPVYEEEISAHHLFSTVDEVSHKFWYLDLGFRFGITQLSSTNAQLKRRLDLPRKLDQFGIFQSPQTPIDRKSEFALTTGYIGVGRRETEWLTWNFYLGLGVGGDRDHQRRLNLNQEVNFNYALYYTGLTTDLYPWGTAQRGRYVSITEHLKASRPYLITGLEFGYLRAKGWGHIAAAPAILYHDEQKVRDWLFSWLVGFGWEFPINEKWVYNIQVHYTFHAYRPEEYDGWNLTFALRYEF